MKGRGSARVGPPRLTQRRQRAIASQRRQLKRRRNRTLCFWLSIVWKIGHGRLHCGGPPTRGGPRPNLETGTTTTHRTQHNYQHNRHHQNQHPTTTQPPPPNHHKCYHPTITTITTRDMGCLSPSPPAGLPLEALPFAIGPTTFTTPTKQMYVYIFALFHTYVCLHHR